MKRSRGKVITVIAGAGALIVTGVVAAGYRREIYNWLYPPPESKCTFCSRGFKREEAEIVFVHEGQELRFCTRDCFVEYRSAGGFSIKKIPERERKLIEQRLRTGNN